MPGKPGAFGLCGGTYETRDRLWNTSRTINWYPSLDDSGGSQSKIQLSPVPGLAPWADLAPGPLRGLWAGDNRLFAVSGGTLYEVADGGAATAVGPLGFHGTPVQFAANGDSLLVATGPECWLFSGGDPETPFRRGGPLAAGTMSVAGVSCIYLDGYYVALTPNSNQVRWSDYDDAGGLIWKDDDVLESMGTLDRAVRLEAHEGHAWLFGRKSIVPLYNTGGNPVFAPIPGATMETGTMAPFSIAHIDQKLYWLGTDAEGYGRVFRTQGYTPVRISNQAIENLIREIMDLGFDERICGAGYSEAGHTFYVLSFPLTQHTFVYDLSTDMWHERHTWNDPAWQFWPGSSFHAHVFGKHLTGNIVGASGGATGAIYRQAVDVYTEAGRPIRRYRIAPYVAADQQWLMHHYLRLFLHGDPEEDVPVSMRYLDTDKAGSNENPPGKWSNTRSVLPFRSEVKFRRLGRSRDRLYEVSLIDSTTHATSMIEAYLHAEQGVQR